KGFREWLVNRISRFCRMGARLHSGRRRAKEDLKLEQIEKDMQEGRIAGPFSRIPFPNSWCRKQAKLCRVFSIWKNKYDTEDMSIRLLINMSHPKGGSKNTLTPRDDSELEYHTFVKF